MNKTEITQVYSCVEKAKRCLLGKIEQDINSRLPEKPTPLDNWDKYKLIKSGEAKLIRNLKIKQIINRYGDSISLVDAFTYPEREEEKLYSAAVKKVESEKNTREMAVELAFNRLADERIMGLIEAKDFLDRLELMQMKEW